MNNQNQLDSLFDQHAQLGDKLHRLQHRRDRSERPPDGSSYSIGAASFISQGRIELTAQEKRELDLEILYTRLGILHLAEEIHDLRYSGDVPGWIPRDITLLQQEVQRFFATQNITV